MIIKPNYIVVCVSLKLHIKINTRSANGIADEFWGVGFAEGKRKGSGRGAEGERKVSRR